MQGTEKASRISYIEIGDTLFTVISVESEKAKEHLYDKIKRLIANCDPQTGDEMDDT